jgi:hypothetical protein
METKACSRDDREGLHDSFRSPAQVPRIDKQTFPSSYRFLGGEVSEYKALQENKPLRVDCENHMIHGHRRQH